jgi:hypothetical protein
MVSGMRDRKEKEQGTVQAAGRPAARVRGAGNEGGRAAWLSATVVSHPLSVGGRLGPPPSAIIKCIIKLLSVAVNCQYRMNTMCQLGQLHTYTIATNFFPTILCKHAVNAYVY